MLESGVVLTIIGAFLAVFFAGVGSCLGVSATGVKSAGALAEKPELFGKVLVLTALPGSQGVYGLLIAILALAKIGLFTGMQVVPVEVGYQLLWAGALMGFSGLFSAWLQGRVAAGGVGAVARNESLGGKAIVLSVIIETYAIFGLLVALLIVNSINLDVVATTVAS